MLLCGAPNPYSINGYCVKQADHDMPGNDAATKLHTNGFSEWTTEDLARQAELDDAAETLRVRVEAAADQILRLVPAGLAAMVARAESETAARRALGGTA